MKIAFYTGAVKSSKQKDGYRHSFSKGYIENTLANLFYELFPEGNYIETLNSIYNKELEKYKKYSTDFYSGVFYPENSKIVEEWKELQTPLNKDELRELCDTHSDFYLFMSYDDSYIVVKRRIYTLNNPEYSAVSIMKELIDKEVARRNEIEELSKSLNYVKK